MIDSTTNSRFSNKQLIVIYTIISLVSLLVIWELAAEIYWSLHVSSSG